nr:hypothetical protein [Tanacetum cinerariifolium]
MSREVIMVGSTMRIPLLYRGEYSQWREQFMNYLEEQTDGEVMINFIQNSDHPLPVVAQIDRLARSLLIQGLPNDIYSLIDSNDTAKDLWDALERQMRGFEYGEQDRKAQNQGDVNDALGYKKKAVVVDSDPLALDQAWMESSSDSDQEINPNMVFMAKMEKVLSDLDENFSSAKETIVEAFPLPGESSQWQYKFPLPVKVVPIARRLEIPLPGVCTAIEEMMKKLPVKDRWQLH